MTEKSVLCAFIGNAAHRSTNNNYYLSPEIELQNNIVDVGTGETALAFVKN